MSEFIYLYRGTAQPPRSPQVMQQTLERWRAWFKDMEAKGHLAQHGQPLEPTAGRVVKDTKGGFTDGPYAETKDIVMGFSVITAKDYEEAVALTKGHPIFEQGGMIEIRTIMKLP
jgi:hypothetical protein